MFVKQIVLSLALAAVLLSGCTDGSAPRADTTAPAHTSSTPGDDPSSASASAALVDEARKWADKWCLVEKGMTRSQVQRVMGESAPDHPSDSLLWGDENFGFGVHITRRNVVSGHWESAPDEVVSIIDCPH